MARLNASLAGRYAIERELGAGGMATVFLANDVKHDRQVALKVLRAELAQALGPERFLRENLAGSLWFDRSNGESAAAHFQRAARDTGNTAVNAVGYLEVIAARRDDPRARCGGLARRADAEVGLRAQYVVAGRDSCQPRPP